MTKCKECGHDPEAVLEEKEMCEECSGEIAKFIQENDYMSQQVADHLFCDNCIGCHVNWYRGPNSKY